MIRDKVIISEGRTMTHVAGDVYFDAEQHVYAHVLKSGALLEVPGVSAILKAYGAMPDRRIPRAVMEGSMKRGHDVHRACHLDVTGELDEEKLSAIVRPYLLAFRRWREEKKPVIVGSEVPMYDPVHDVCGTADLIVQNRQEDVGDIKSGEPADWHEYQLAGYCIIRWGKDWLRHGMFGLYLRSNGTHDYAPVPVHRQIAAGAEWLRMVKNYNEKRHSLFGED